MEADWEVEAGPGLPTLDADWAGWVDLGRYPELISELPEARQCEPLARLLLRLNAGPEVEDELGSSGGPGEQALPALRTLKCDFWVETSLDPYEMEASVEEAVAGLACYVDIVPRRTAVFTTLATAEQWARAAVARLRGVACRCSHVDLVIRRAVAQDADGFGVTAYVFACGRDADGALRSLADALNALGDALSGAS